MIKETRNNHNVNDETLDRLLQEKINSLQIEIESLRKELNYYKAEMEKLLSPPLIEATVLDVMDNNRVLVRSSSGPNLLVNLSNNIKSSDIKPGMSVALNQRGSTIIELLKQRDDPYVKSMEIIDKPNVTYEEIGA